MISEHIMCWNVRGLYYPAKREAIHEVATTNRISIMCLQHTKLAIMDQRMCSEIGGPRLNNFSYLPADGSRGGAATFWDDDILQHSDINIRNFSLSVRLTQRSANTAFHLTNVYGPTDDTDKENFLQEMCEVAPSG